ncbi:DUF222 domain-containing protein, partial [Actinomycetospora straminea]|uniref:DUF222 domain-containing protein n=1 Tax=Actinomycetospora straminea TaxID=663607 RepID=UPI0031ED5D07
MSERVGAAGRELLDRAREAEVARRRAYFARLEEVAELERLGVAEQAGDRDTARLVQELWHVDAHDAKRWCDEAADLLPQVSLLGESLPARLPATASVAAAGQVGAGHVAVIRRTMARLERVDTVTVEQWGQAEATLAEQATWLPPRRLAKVAEAVLARLDPDGVAPEDGEDCRDELVWARRRRDGSFVFTGRLHDPVDGEAFCEVIDALAAPCGPDDRRELGRRRADGLKDLVQDARRPGGLTTDTDRSDAGAGVDES